jgi:arsenite-transporting ATPase
MLDRLGAALFEGIEADAVLYEGMSQELDLDGEGGATLRLALPFAERGSITLKKIGLELVVGVDGQRRTIMLPPALHGYRPSGAAFADGALEVTFDAPERAAAID